MAWLMEILKIELEEHLSIKYCVTRAFNIDKNPKYDEYQHGFLSMAYIYIFFYKKTFCYAWK